MERNQRHRGIWAAVILVSCCPAAFERGLADGGSGARMVIDDVDRFRVCEPLFEGVRIVLNHRGEEYSPAYIQGISGAAFRIAGICPCAADCSSQMSTTDLIKLCGYECTESILGWTGDVEDAKENMIPLIPKVKDSIRAGRPVLLWYAFADTAYEVVTGFDDNDGVLLGRHMWQGPDDGPASAKQTRAEEAAQKCPALGAIFIGGKVGTLDRNAAEVAALKEAVRHARDPKAADAGPSRQGINCYDRWVETFNDSAAKRTVGDTYCCSLYRSTHRAAGRFLKEIAPRHPKAAGLLVKAARDFAREATALDKAAPLLAWESPEHDPERNAKLWPLLAEARGGYADAITHIEEALPLLD